MTLVPNEREKALMEKYSLEEDDLRAIRRTLAVHELTGEIKAAADKAAKELADKEAKDKKEKDKKDKELIPIL